MRGLPIRCLLTHLILVIKLYTMETCTTGSVPNTLCGKKVSTHIFHVASALVDRTPDLWWNMLTLTKAVHAWKICALARFRQNGNLIYLVDCKYSSHMWLECQKWISEKGFLTILNGKGKESNTFLWHFDLAFTSLYDSLKKGFYRVSIQVLQQVHIQQLAFVGFGALLPHCFSTRSSCSLSNTSMFYTLIYHKTNTNSLKSGLS